jgi:hypothetical protein
MTLVEFRRWMEENVAVAIVCAAVAVVLQYFTEIILSDQLLERAIARVVTPLIGELHYKTGARDRILVVHVDSVSKDDAGGNWPASYRYHATSLSLLGNAKDKNGQPRPPKAIFVDLMFVQEREDRSIDALTRVLCDLSDRGVRLFLAVPAEDPRLRSGIEGLRSPMTGATCYDKVSIVQLPDSADRVAWQYPLWHDVGGNPALRLPSAALAVRDALHPPPLRAYAEQLALVWGTRDNDFGLTWEVPAAGGKPQPYCRGWKWRHLLPGFVQPESFLRPDVADTRALCVFHESMTTLELRALVADPERGWTPPEIVFYGASVEGNDVIVSPVHGPIPGIYLHAMALDNLLVYGDDYKHHPKPETWPDRIALMVKMLAGFFAVSFLFQVAQAVVRRLRAWWVRRPSRVVIESELGRQAVDARAHGLTVLEETRGKSFRRLPYAVAAAIGDAVGQGASRLAASLSFTMPVGLFIAWIAHHCLDLSVLTYAPIILFCALSEITSASDTARRYLGLRDETSSTEHD